MKRIIGIFILVVSLTSCAEYDSDKKFPFKDEMFKETK